jgi:hypothetical protein
MPRLALALLVRPLHHPCVNGQSVVLHDATRHCQGCRLALLAVGCVACVNGQSVVLHDATRHCQRCRLALLAVGCGACVL